MLLQTILNSPNSELVWLIIEVVLRESYFEQMLYKCGKVRTLIRERLLLEECSNCVGKSKGRKLVTKENFC